MTKIAQIKFPLTMKIDSQEMLDHIFKEVEGEDSYGWYGLKDSEGNIRHYNSYKDVTTHSRPIPPGRYRFDSEGEIYRVEEDILKEENK